MNQKVFGPVSFLLYDPADVAIRITDPGASFPVLLDPSQYTIAPASPATGFPAYFTVTLNTARPQNAQVDIRGLSIPSRTTDVTRGGVLRSTLLEAELDRMVIVGQELRRDISEGTLGDDAVQAAVAAAQNYANQALAANTSAAGHDTAAGNSATAAAASAAAAAAAVAAYPPGMIYGMSIANNVGSPNLRIDVSSGKCRDIADAKNIALAATITKRLDANWVAGNGNGGLDTGARAANTWYFPQAIDTIAGGAGDVIIGTSPVAPVMPGGYTPKRRLGAFKTDPSANIIPMFQEPGTGMFLYKSAPRDLSAVAINTTPTLYTLPSVPLGIKTRARLLVNPTTTALISLSDPDLGAPTDTTLGVIGGGQWNVIDVWTDTAQRIYIFANTGTPTLSIFVQGFHDMRDAVI
ncbi:hypothetical protein [Bradyrhizobium sp. NAS80.1]|uniref:hypothetical protein n=1 Tax=Bradyrhizobium sp. NAS80.1 TaxID=1680159 RepID=UPI0011613479|nr:hypothetical protein [Bradyrhizobium sp. NAS80.1]